MGDESGREERMVHAVKKYCFCQRCCFRRTSSMVAKMDKALVENDPNIRRTSRHNSIKCCKFKIGINFSLSKRKNSSHSIRRCGLISDLTPSFLHKNQT